MRETSQEQTAGDLPASPSLSSDPTGATFSQEGSRNPDVWVAAEVLPLWRTIHADATLHPAISAPPDYATQTWTRDEALLELVRRRLGGLGPTTPAALAASLAVDPADIEPALLRLQSEGYVMQGRFTPDAPTIEWCERHLLARIHRYTIGRLRREIEPVSRRDLMRFLTDWQHLTPDTRLEGPDGLIATLHQLEGYEGAAGAWETELLPSRVGDYTSRWLDELCRAGRFGWNRLRAGGGSAGPVRATPIVLLPRRQMAIWTSMAAGEQVQDQLLSSRAQAVADALASHGALFFDELLDVTHLLRTELENALGELVAAGRVTADSFAGLRALLLPAAKRDSRPHRRARRHALSEIEDAGRWSLARPSPGPSGEKVAARAADEGPMLAGNSPGAAQGKGGPSSQPTVRKKEGGEDVEHVARVLLRRYGVVFWKLLEREAPWLPSWRELLRVYHRLEARGEIRGGRFVEGLVGEQFALPEAIGALRGVRQRDATQQLVCVSGSDPLNLVGTVLAGDKLPALAGTRVLYEDGVPVAALVANKPQFLQEGDGATQQRWRNALLRRPGSQAHGIGLAV